MCLANLSPARFLRLAMLAIAPAVAAALGGCANDNIPSAAARPAYSLTLRKGTHYDLDAPPHRSGFDTTHNAWWLVGNGVTVQLTPLQPSSTDANASAPAADAAGPVVLYLRTTANPAAQSQVTHLRVATPAQGGRGLPLSKVAAPQTANSDSSGSVVLYLCATASPDIIHVTRHDSPGDIQILRDTGYIRITRAATRVRVVLSAEFLRRHAPDGAAITWFDTAPAALPDQSHTTAPAAAPAPSPPRP